METLFGLLGVLTLPWWASMLLFPRTRATRTLVLSPWPFVGLAGIQALLLIAAAASGGLPGSLGLAPIGSALARGPWTLLALWTHVLAANLFVGVWIFRDARYYGRLPRGELLLAWIGGPLGLGVYLLRRRRWAASDPVRLLN